MSLNLPEKLKEELEANLSDPSFTAKDLALKLGMSHSSLLRKVKSATGKTINQLIKEMRLEKAQQLLKEDSHSLSEVSVLTGFTSQAYFTACFRKHFGYTPGDVRADQMQNAPVETQNFASPHGETPNPNKSTRSKNIIITCSALIITAAAVLIFIFASGRIVNDKSIAVLPLRSNSGTVEEDKQAAIIWEDIISVLNAIEVFDVRSAASSAKYTPDVGMSNRKISRKLKVKYLIEGSVSTQDSLWINIQMIRGKNDDHFGAEDYYIPESHFEKSIEMLKMAEHVAFELKTKLKPGERSAILTACSNSAESMNNYSTGKSLLYSGKDNSPKAAIPYFLEAIELDSSWASPYLLMSVAYMMMFEDNPKMEYLENRLREIQRAHRIQPGPLSTKALSKYYRDIGEVKKSYKWYKKYKREYPNDYDNKYHFGQIVRHFGLWKEAEEMLISIHPDMPRYTPLNFALSETYDLQRDFPSAIKYLRHIKMLIINFPHHHFNLANISLKWKGDIAEAREIFEKSVKKESWVGTNAMQAVYLSILLDTYEKKYQDALNKLSKWKVDPNFLKNVPPYYYRPRHLLAAELKGYLGQSNHAQIYYDSTRIFIEKKLDEVPYSENNPRILSCLGVAYAGLGNKDKAHEIARQVQKLLTNEPDAFFGPFAMEDVAWIYTITGDYKKAFKIIRKLLSKPGPLTTKLLEIDPKWADLRDKPDFQNLISKYSIPVIEITESITDFDEPKLQLPEIGGPTFTDQRDGNIYHYKKIGTQTWTTQNLAYLPHINLPDSSSNTDPRYYVYAYKGTSVDEAKESNNYKTYGVLYNWAAAMTACPEGWHLPSDEEWKTFEKHLGMSNDEVDMMKHRLTGSVAEKIKYTSGWINNANGDNSAHFYTLPAGFLDIDHIFKNIKRNTGWWLSSSVNNSAAMTRAIAFDAKGLWRHGYDKQLGASVRCVKD